MKKIIFSLVLLLGIESYAIGASYMNCNGMDNTGHRVTLFGDIAHDIININGSSLKIVGLTKNGQGVVTEKYISNYGIWAYVSLIPVGNNAIMLYQFNAVTEALLATAYLSCSFTSGSGNVLDYPVFKLIKK